MGRHSGFKGGLYILSKRIGCHGYNGYCTGILPGQAADSPGRIISVHLRHLNVHQYSIIGAWNAAFKFIQSLGPVGPYNRFRPLHPQQLTENLCIDGIVLSYQEPAAGKISGPGQDRLFSFFPSGPFIPDRFKFQIHLECASLVFPAPDPDFSLHKVCQSLGDA